MIQFTNDELRDLEPFVEALLVDGLTFAADHPHHPHLAGAGLLVDLANAITAAAAADPDCTTCHGSGTLTLPCPLGGYDNRPCPVCRPWPQGFPGLRWKDLRVWQIAPYGPGESVATMREISQPSNQGAAHP